MASKINIIIRLQHWMDSVPGQTFLNYAYSWGASIVILGALFKLTHLPGGNLMLFIGMGTEVVVFFLSAFDRPFDKREIGKDLPHDYETDEQIAAHYQEVLAKRRAQAEAAAATSGATADAPAATAGGDVAAPAPVHTAAAAQAAPAQPQPVIINMPQDAAATPAAKTTADAAAKPQPAPAPADDAAAQAETAAAAAAAIAAHTAEGAVPFEQEAKRLAEIIRLANDELLKRTQAVLSPEMEEATGEYVKKLKTLSETFQKVDEQSARLALDSEEMNNLSRTLTAINKTYDLHFKSISTQVGTIEEINEQTRRLAKQIEELNDVYSHMIYALKQPIAMSAPGAAAAGQGSAPQA